MNSAAVLVAVTVVLPSARSADWPQFRGPERTGVSQETGLLKEWPKQGPKLLWQLSDIGDGYGPPAVVGGRIYLVSNRGMNPKSSRVAVVSGAGITFMVTSVKAQRVPQEPAMSFGRS